MRVSWGKQESGFTGKRRPVLKLARMSDELLPPRPPTQNHRVGFAPTGRFNSSNICKCWHFQLSSLLNENFPGIPGAEMGLAKQRNVFQP